MLSAPTAWSMRYLLSYLRAKTPINDTKFYVDKSKCKYLANYCGRSLFCDDKCIYCLYGLPFNNVKFYSHYGNIVSLTSSNEKDILF